MLFNKHFRRTVSMQLSDLPIPPYRYEDVTAFAFIPDDTVSECWIAGTFRKAPTGPFSEVWQLKRGFGGWTTQTIVVDNPVRLDAGRRIWGLPKVIGVVRFDSECRDDNVSYEAQGKTNHLSFPRLGPHHSTSTSWNFGLLLPGNRSATLSFLTIDSAFAARNDRNVQGSLFRFTGAAELSAPNEWANVA